MKLYMAMWTDYITGGKGALLGIYDNKEAAEKRAEEFSKKYIDSDKEGPLGNAYVSEITLNEDVPGCVGEAYDMENWED